MTSRVVLHRITLAASVTATLMAGFILAMRVLTKSLFFDEINHAHLLWMLSQGLHPYLDYRCPYAQAAYILTLPLFRALPESAYSLLVLRCLMLLIVCGLVYILATHGRRLTRHLLWGLAPGLLLATAPPISRFLVEYSADHFAMLAAAAAMGLYFAKPTPWRLGTAAALSMWSVAFAPKYGLILACGALAWAAGAVRQDASRWRSMLLSGMGGLAVGFAGVWLLYASAGASLSQAWFWVYRIQGEYNGRFVAHGPLWFAVFRVLTTYWPTGVILATGVLSWLWLARQGRLGVAWGPTGLLVGCAVYVVVVPQLLEQYYTPVLVTLAFYAPYVCRAAREHKWTGGCSLALAVFTLIIMVQRAIAVIPELQVTVVNARDDNPVGFKAGFGPPAIKMLGFTQYLLDVIPRNERFVGVGASNPIFRRDATYMTSDERPSVSLLLPSAHPARRYFDPAYFRDALERRPPALISLSLLNRNYPPGWADVAKEFLGAHGSDYRQILPSPADVFVRKDLPGVALQPGRIP